MLDRLVSSVSDRLLTEVSPFHIERWKRERADKVSQSTVNRELNIVRGCFSRAAELARAVRVTRNHTEEAMRGGTKRGTEARAAGGNSDPKTEAKS